MHIADRVFVGLDYTVDAITLRVEDVTIHSEAVVYY
jgi:hypothetical protein